MKIVKSKASFIGSAVLLAWGMSCQCSPAQTPQYSWSIIAGQTISTNHLCGHVDGTNGNASFYNPWAITADNQGRLYVAETDDIRKVERIGSDWVVTTLPLSNSTGPSSFEFHWLANNASGNLFASYETSSRLLEISPSGPDWTFSQIAPHCTYPFTNVLDCWSPGAMVIDAKGNFFIYDKSHHTLRQINFDGTSWIAKIIAGAPDVYASVDGTNGQASFDNVMGITVDQNGNLYATEYEQNTIRKIAPEGTNWVVTTIAGSAGGPFGVDVDGTNQQALFSGPYGIAADSKGALYVLDQISNRLRKITPVGTDWVVSTIVVDNPSLSGPMGITVDSADNLYIADTANCTIRLGTLLPSLHVVRTGDRVVVSWPSSALNYALESTTTLDDGQSWSPVTDEVTTVGNSFVMTNRLGASGTFFRLRQQ